MDSTNNWEAPAVAKICLPRCVPTATLTLDPIRIRGSRYKMDPVLGVSTRPEWCEHVWESWRVWEGGLFLGNFAFIPRTFSFVSKARVAKPSFPIPPLIQWRNCCSTSGYLSVLFTMRQAGLMTTVPHRTQKKMYFALPPNLYLPLQARLVMDSTVHLGI
ncbi:hypothetical protein E2C01_038193 [Portunus trituberculatus]|uniref:Uncharacterized protein n=1 Tax=Portunus trituberculatus TaxID=210409 RepID=A0A5B7FA81_PORTR|nr:hypothetical protein [Portunus trituberculatus]